MDIVTISKTVFSTLLPFLKKSKSVKKITSDIGEAADNSLSELWTKIKPVFVEEFDDGEDTLSEDVENEAVVGHILKKTLKKDESLATEISSLLDKIKPGSVNIENSHNVVQGSNVSAHGDINIGDKNDNSTHFGGDQVNVGGDQITVQGNVHVGDIINIQQVVADPKGAKPATPSPVEVSDSVTGIRKYMAEGKMKQAIEALLVTTRNMDTDLHNNAILLASRWNSLQNDIQNGIIADDNANIRQNQIRVSLLYTLDSLDEA
jgi:hypothetical protein